MYKKIFIAFWLLILVLGYSFKDKNPFEHEFLKGKKKEPEVAKPIAATPNKPVFRFRFEVGQCVMRSGNSWDYTKILKRMNDQYEFLDCEKFKGCAKVETLSREQFELNHRDDNVFPCP